MKSALSILLGVGAGLVASQATAQAEASTADAATPAGIPLQAPPPEAAAAPAAAPAPAPAQSRFVEEVIITAQKREENLQNVPISVQAFSAAALDAKGIDDPKALQLATPGLQYNIFAGYSLIYIRGVGTDAFIPSADASVATYIDNVYYPFGHSLASSFGAVQRVEVLKGPQGTLFGRNSTGGAINIVTKDPGSEAETSLLASYGSYNAVNTRAYTNIPLGNQFAVSVSGIYNTQDDYYTLSSNSPRGPLPPEVTKGFRVKARWAPVEELSIVLSATGLDVDGANSMLLPATDIKPLGVALNVQQEAPYKTSTDAPIYISTTAHIFSGDIKYTLPWFDTRLILAKQDITSPALADYDGSRQALASFESRGQYANVKTAEFQILSNRDTPLADHFKWLAGVYAIDSTAGYDPLYFSAGANLLTYLAAPTGLLTGLTSPLVSFLKSPPPGAIAGVLSPFTSLAQNGVTLGLQGLLDTQSTAGFFQGTWNFTDELALTLGGRYQTETRKLTKSNVNVATAADVAGGNPGTRLITFTPQSAHTSNFSPKAVLDFKPSDESLVYGSFTQGFKSGTYNIINIYTPTQYIKPEQVTAYELGLKTTLLDGHLRFNTAVFQNKIKDLQVQTISLTSGGAVRFETAGGARIRGADFDTTWEFVPDTVPGLVLIASGAILDGVYTSYPNGSGFNPTTGIFQGGLNFTGNKVVRTPKFSGDGGLGYTFDVGPGSLELAADVYYNDGFYYSAQNTKTASESSYYVVNARASYFYQPWGLRLTVFGKNLNDGKYSYVKQELDFGTANLLAPPATYGLRLNWDF